MNTFSWVFGDKLSLVPIPRITDSVFRPVLAFSLLAIMPPVASILVSTSVTVLAQSMLFGSVDLPLVYIAIAVSYRAMGMHIPKPICFDSVPCGKCVTPVANSNSALICPLKCVSIPVKKRAFLANYDIVDPGPTEQITIKVLDCA